MRSYFILLFISASITGLSQAGGVRIPLDSQLRKTPPDSMVMFHLELSPLDLPRYSGIIYNLDKTIKARGTWIYEGKELIEDGAFVFFHINGKVESEGSFERGIKVGAWKRFAFDGTPKPERYYDPAKAEMIRTITSGKPVQN